MQITNSETITTLEKIYKTQKKKYESSAYFSFYSEASRVMCGIRSGIIYHDLETTFKKFSVLLLREIDKNIKFEQIASNIFFQNKQIVDLKKPTAKIVKFENNYTIQLDIFNYSFWLSKEIIFKELVKKNEKRTKVTFKITIRLEASPANPMIKHDYYNFIKSNIRSFDLQILDANIKFAKLSTGQKIKLKKQFEQLSLRIKKHKEFQKRMQYKT